MKLTTKGSSLTEARGMIVQNEAARANPSVGTLSRLAEALGVSVARLIEAPTDRRHTAR